jgi:hypothetical protein
MDIDQIESNFLMFLKRCQPQDDLVQFELNMVYDGPIDKRFVDVVPKKIVEYLKEYHNSKTQCECHKYVQNVQFLAAVVHQCND